MLLCQYQLFERIVTTNKVCKIQVVADIKLGQLIGGTAGGKGRCDDDD